MLIHDVRDSIHDEREAAIDRRDEAARDVAREQTAIDALTGALANLDEAIAALDGEAPVAPKVAPTTTPTAPKPAGARAIRPPAPPSRESQSPKAKAERTREQVVSLLELAQEPMTIRQLSEATGVAQNSVRRAVDVLLARRQIKGVDLPGVSAAAFATADPPRPSAAAPAAAVSPTSASAPSSDEDEQPPAPAASPSTDEPSSAAPSSPTADASDAERRAEEEAAWQEAQQPTPPPFTPLRDELAAAAPRDALDGLSRLQLWGMVETRGITDVDPDAGEDQLRTIVRADIERAKAELAALDVTDLDDDDDEDEDEVEASPPPLPTDALARQILHHLGDGEPDDDASIARALFRNRLVVSDTLVKLERHGHVRKLPDGRYVKREPVSAS